MGVLLPRTLKDDLRVYRRRIRIKININPVCPHSREINEKVEKHSQQHNVVASNEWRLKCSRWF